MGKTTTAAKAALNCTLREIREKIESESSLPPGKRTQMVPCALCTRGGWGDKSCGAGGSVKKFTRALGCFSGTLMEEIK